MDKYNNELVKTTELISRILTDGTITNFKLIEEEQELLFTIKCCPNTPIDSLNLLQNTLSKHGYKSVEIIVLSIELSIIEITLKF